MRRWVFVVLGMAVLAAMASSGLLWAQYGNQPGDGNEWEAPLSLRLEYQMNGIRVFCEAGTGNRVYHAFWADRSGLAVVEGGCLLP